jgi:hypothetical protein
MIRTTIAIAALCAALAMPGAAGAADTALGCFTRIYDRAHLARHPDQLVTAVKLHIMGSSPGNAEYWFALQVNVRGRNDILHTGGYCIKEGSGLQCRVACDGGGVHVSPRGSHVMMYLDRIRMATCGKEYVDEGEDVSGGKDDKIFRLDRVDGAACKGVEP